MVGDTIDLTLESSDESEGGSVVELSHTRQTQATSSFSSINRPLPTSLESTSFPFRRLSPSSPRSSISRGPISPPPVRRTAARILNEAGYRETSSFLSTQPSTSSIVSPVSASSVGPAPFPTPFWRSVSNSTPIPTPPPAPIPAPAGVATRPKSPTLAAGSNVAVAPAPEPVPILATLSTLAPAASVHSPAAVTDAHVKNLPTVLNIGSENKEHPRVSPQKQPPSPKARQTDDNIMTPKAQRFATREWTVDKMAQSLTAFRQDIRNDHSQMTGYIIDSVEAREYRTHTGADLFANVSSKPLPQAAEPSMKIKFKQHSRSKDNREERHHALCIKTDEERVPPYRNHYVETRKNVLTPGTMLTFVPHVRDLDSSEEAKYNHWLKKLEEQDRQSGFKPVEPAEKLLQTVRTEIAATVSLYLDKWLNDLSIPGCDKSALIRYTFREETTLTPRQRTDILKLHHAKTGPSSLEATEVARMFTQAFHRVFGGDHLSLKKKIDLRKVLLLDEAVEDILEPRPKVNYGTNEDDDDDDVDDSKNKIVKDSFSLDSYLGIYWSLGCAICYSNACDHGDYSLTGGKEALKLPGDPEAILSRRRQKNECESADIYTSKVCRRQCHRAIPAESADLAKEVSHKAWTNEELLVLKTLHATLRHSKVKRDPFCVVAEFLDRDCCDVYQKFQSLPVHDFHPPKEPAKRPQMRNITWYDRYKKALIGDWKQHTSTHDHDGRVLHDPCAHEGPCTQETCICVQNGSLCEKLCECTAECCVYKFTGCACHSQGKNCFEKQKDRQCICVQLGRECDPDLCGSCGVIERADPLNMKDEVLHSKGCQNCAIQRGNAKALVLGQSQLQGCGYGLYTAVDIAQEEFVIEYVGEVITHDEGIRREQRRGDVFQNKDSVSYVFTLLEQEGLWVDAATYGNLSRYINHAPEGGVRGCNIAPKVMYVNGEYRIKFWALRNIKAGEELFFNYGEHFPHLTEKLMDEGEKGSSQLKKRGRRPKQSVEETARKTSTVGQKKSAKSRSKKDTDLDLDDEDNWITYHLAKTTRKRKHASEEFEEDEYQPTGTDATGSRADSPASMDSDEPMAKSLDRLRKRARRVKAHTREVSENPRGQPKTRGKRGGARPGSGRPRKHPRPPPKPAPTIDAQKAATSEPASDLVTALKQPEPVLVHRQESAEHTHDGRYPSMTEGDDDEDDDDDQDVVIRKRQDRATRARRPPAKFREEELLP